MWPGAVSEGETVVFCLARIPLLCKSPSPWVGLSAPLAMY
jgi:hypothetical protein